MKKISLFLIISALSAFIWTKALLYSQNSLFNNNFWFPYRAHFFEGSGFGLENLICRSVLAGNSLRTDELIIYQRIFSKRKINPSEITFDFRIKEDSFLDIIFNGDGETFEALRISRFNYYPSLVYKAHKDGHFLWKKPIQISIPFRGFLTADLRQTGKDIVLRINGVEYVRFEGRIQEGHVGFEVYSGSEVKNPIFKSSKGTVIEAGFSLEENFYKYLIMNFFLISGILALLAVPFGRNYFQRLKSLLFFIFGLGLLWYSFDFYYYSRKTVRWDFSSKYATVLKEEDNKGFDYEYVRSSFFREWFLLLGGRYPDRESLAALNLLPRGYSGGHYCFEGKCSIFRESNNSHSFEPPGNKRVRIMIIGGSMSAGAGVEKLSQGYVETLYHSLDKKFKGKLEIEFLNTSSGGQGLFLKRIYDDIENFKPHLILVDYLIKGTHDEALKYFFKKTDKNSAAKVIMRSPAHLLKVHGPISSIRPILSKGLNRKNTKHGLFFQYDLMLAELQDRYGFIFLDPNEALLTKQAYENGDLWWDHWHLTVYGNRLLADYLKDHFIELIEKKFWGKSKRGPDKAPLKPKISTLLEQPPASR